MGSQLGGSMHGSADTRVGATTADVPRKRQINGAIVRLGVVGQQRDDRKDHPWGAVAALHTTYFDKCLLNGVQSAVAHKPLNGGDAPARESSYL
jgi:hypothetical protein